MAGFVLITLRVMRSDSDLARMARYGQHPTFPAREFEVVEKTEGDAMEVTQ